MPYNTTKYSQGAVNKSLSVTPASLSSTKQRIYTHIEMPTSALPRLQTPPHAMTPTQPLFVPLLFLLPLISFTFSTIFSQL